MLTESQVIAAVCRALRKRGFRINKFLSPSYDVIAVGTAGIGPNLRSSVSPLKSSFVNWKHYSSSALDDEIEVF